MYITRVLCVSVIESEYMLHDVWFDDMTILQAIRFRNFGEWCNLWGVARIRCVCWENDKLSQLRRAIDWATTMYTIRTLVLCITFIARLAWLDLNDKQIITEKWVTGKTSESLCWQLIIICIFIAGCYSIFNREVIWWGDFQIVIVKWKKYVVK